MKKLFFSAALLFGFFLLSSNSVQAQGNCMNEHQAIARARQNCPNMPSPSDGHYEAYLVATPLCTQGSTGCAMVWDVWFVYECQSPPGTACRPLPPAKKATVSTGCDGSVTVTCLPL
jgi:hypothetical protein